MPALILLGAEHGTSRQEALSLKWSDINFDFDEQGMIQLFRTKNSQRRTVFLMPRTRQALLDWREHLRQMRERRNITDIKSDHVFCRLDGTPFKEFIRAWRRCCEIARFTDLHYHDLRHTFCSNLILSGSELKDVKEMVGHGDISMTDRYSHINLMRQRYLQNQLAAHYGSGFDGV